MRPHHARDGVDALLLLADVRGAAESVHHHVHRRRCAWSRWSKPRRASATTAMSVRCAVLERVDRAGAAVELGRPRTPGRRPRAAAPRRAGARKRRPCVQAVSARPSCCRSRGRRACRPRSTGRTGSRVQPEAQRIDVDVAVQHDGPAPAVPRRRRDGLLAARLDFRHAPPPRPCSPGSSRSHSARGGVSSVVNDGIRIRSRASRTSSSSSIRGEDLRSAFWEGPRRVVVRHHAIGRSSSNSGSDAV